VCGIPPNRSKLRVRKWNFHLTDDQVFPAPLDDYVGLQQLFGIVIHCERLDIIDSDLMARIYFNSRDGFEVLSFYSSKVLEETYFNPKILIKSDKLERSIFDIREIVSCIDENLLPAVVEVSREHGLYLESDFR
jgi:hypothetical protein